MVVALPVAHLAEDHQPGLVVVCHDGRIHIRVALESSFSDYARGMGNLPGIPLRLLGYHVHGPGNGGRTEKGRASPSDHFHPVDHRSRYLFDPVDPRQCTEYRPGINQYLGIRPLQAVYADLLRTAVLAIVLHPYPGLEHDTFGQIGGIGIIEYLGVHHVHEGRGHFTEGLATAG